MPQPNMQQMMKQVQQMQAEMMKAQEALKDVTVEASAGGGMVTAAVNEALRSAQEVAAKKMSDATGGLGGPGGALGGLGLPGL
jgi:DNA-binding protein YbaB